MMFRQILGNKSSSQELALNLNAGHSVYQLVVLFTLVFKGDSLFDIESGRYCLEGADGF